MSLRTKVLAAVVGLHGAFLLVALLWLLREESGSPDLGAEMTALGAALAEGEDGRERAAERLEALRRAGAEEVYVVEETMGSRAGQVVHRVVSAKGLVAGRSGEDLAASPAGQWAVEAFRARRQNVGGDRAIPLAVVLPGEGPEAARRGLVVISVGGAHHRSGVRILYLAMVGGVLVVSLVSYLLLSRFVISPLAHLTRAAGRIAAGDYRFQLEGRGTSDELDRTIAAFNRMAREIAEYQGHLEDRVLTALGRIKKAEQHLAIAQRLAATGKLASGVAHEINNPLGGMQNAVRALTRGDLPPEKANEYLELVSEGLARVEDTVKKFLSFTPRRVEPRPTDLSEVGRKAFALAAHRIERKGIRVETRWAAPEQARVFGDPHELQQVVLNLLLNAADAIPEGRAGRILLASRRVGDDVVLEVADDGVGMSPEDQDRCFDLFFTTKSVGEGTGLGLAVVHNIVTNHGGRIEVESAPGKGAIFRIHFPAEGPLEPEAAPPAAAPAASGPPAGEPVPGARATPAS
jgi:signal transduction histidine kinase